MEQKSIELNYSFGVAIKTSHRGYTVVVQLRCNIQMTACWTEAEMICTLGLTFLPRDAMHPRH